MKRPALRLLLVALWVHGAEADDWPGAQPRNVFSSDGSRFVRILPGSSWGEVVGFAGAESGGHARGLFYALQEDRSYRLVADSELVNPVAPVDAMVTKRGQLITFDNWYNFGYGAIVAVYDGGGTLQKQFTLEDLYGEKRSREIPGSVSSRWWRCNPMGFSDPGEEQLVYVFEHFGGTFVFDLSSLSFSYSAGKAECQSPAGPFSATLF